ncbi:IS3 family transposase [Lysinibacillus sp. FSL M8-0355]
MSYEALKKTIEKFIDYYNNERIKTKTGWLEPSKLRGH